MQIGFTPYSPFANPYRQFAASTGNGNGNSSDSRNLARSLALSGLAGSAEVSSAAVTPTAANDAGTLPALAADSASIAAASEAFAADAGKMLQDAGVSLPPEIMLMIGSDGQVLVANSRADANHIEQQFVARPELRQQFNQIAAAASRQRGESGIVSGGLRFHLVLTRHGPEIFFAGSAKAVA